MSNVYDSDNTNDNEKRKFQPDKNNNTAVNVISANIEDLLEDIATNTGGSSASFDTLQFAGSVGLTEIDLPSSASGVITQVIVSCRVQSPANRRLLFSLDGGATYFTLSPGSMVGWEPKDIEQIKVKGNAASVDYDVLINVRTP